MAFLTELAQQEADWCGIRSSESDTGFILMGDLNQDLLPAGHYYGSDKGRCALRASISRAGLTCLTGGANDPLAALGSPIASIDHICVSGKPLLTGPLHIWPAPGQLGNHLTDHHGVAVTLELVDQLF
jgi:endonuclease/exonuclease/phosphatase family metal-dependent hydrolase